MNSIIEDAAINLGNKDFTLYDLPFEIKKLRQECEELKKQLMQKDEINTFFNTPIEGWSSDPCGICKYKNCLTEIKEILEIHKDNKCAICPKFDECFEHPSCDNIILQIISECEVNND